MGASVSQKITSYNLNYLTGYDKGIHFEDFGSYYNQYFSLNALKINFEIFYFGHGCDVDNSHGCDEDRVLKLQEKYAKQHCSF